MKVFYIEDIFISIIHYLDIKQIVSYNILSKIHYQWIKNHSWFQELYIKNDYIGSQA